MSTTTSNSSFKSKLLKKITPTNSIGDALYSGIETARRAIQKPGIPFSLRSRRSKHSREGKNVVFAASSQPVLPPITAQYHSWNEEYHPIRTRENLKKSMTKDPYSQRKYPYAQASMSITTEEECHPVLIPAHAIRIEQPIVREPPKQADTIRYVRAKDLLSSERFLPAVFTQKRSQPFKVESKISFPLIDNIKPPGIFNRTRLQEDPRAIRRPPRILKLAPLYETAAPLEVYG